jgi:hypothetical protein
MTTLCHSRLQYSTVYPQVRGLRIWPQYASKSASTSHQLYIWLLFFQFTTQICSFCFQGLWRNFFNFLHNSNPIVNTFPKKFGYKCYRHLKRRATSYQTKEYFWFRKKCVWWWHLITTLPLVFILFYRNIQRVRGGCDKTLLYRTSGVIFFIDYCTAIRDTRKG